MVLNLWKWENKPAKVMEVSDKAEDLVSICRKMIRIKGVNGETKSGTEVGGGLPTLAEWGDVFMNIFVDNEDEESGSRRANWWSRWV